MMDDIVFRRAKAGDLAAIIALLAQDQLGAIREMVTEPLDPRYLAAFRDIERDPNQLLAVADRGGRVVGCLQLSFIPGLSRLGSWRGQVEAVRIASSERGQGAGEAMMRWAIAQCASRGCTLVQLTTDKTRKDAHRFYERLGFAASHEGMKLKLD